MASALYGELARGCGVASDPDGGATVTQVIRTDYCIAGTGPAGSVLAYKLAATGNQVLLLDQK